MQGAWYLELLARHIRLSTYIFLALFYHYTFDMEWVSLGAGGNVGVISKLMRLFTMQAVTLTPGWIAWVFARNYLVMGVMYGGWHWVLFDSPYAEGMKTRKFDPKLPSVRFIWRFHLPVFGQVSRLFYIEVVH